MTGMEGMSALEQEAVRSIARTRKHIRGLQSDITRLIENGPWQVNRQEDLVRIWGELCDAHEDLSAKAAAVYATYPDWISHRIISAANTYHQHLDDATLDSALASHYN